MVHKEDFNLCSTCSKGGGLGEVEVIFRRIEAGS